MREMSADDEKNGSNPLWWLRILLTGDISHLVEEALDILLILLQRLNWRRPQGIYQILDYDTVLELTDAKGQRAVIQRNKQIRFLQDYVVAFWDSAYGDGDLFAEYACSPGVPVDRFREGSRTYTLISLREVKSRGDILPFHIRRVVHNGFTQPQETWETQIQHDTDHLRIAIIFPRERPCQRAVLVQKNINRTRELGAEHLRTLENGRQILEWEVRHPRLHERYLIKWTW